MAKLIPTLFFVCTTFVGSAQEERIDTDRPDQTESSGIVPKNFFQLEIGFNKENGHFKNYDLVYPTGLFKYGLGRIELRLETAFISSYEHLIPQPKWTTGFEPVEIGFKFLIAEEKKILPKTSLIVHAALPVLASKPFRPQHLAPSFRLTTQKTFTPNFQIGANLGAEWDGFNASPWWLYTISPGFDFAKRWYGYIEAFGFIHTNTSPLNSADAGVAYSVTNNIRVDISAGAGISNAAPKSYVAIGFSFRFNTKH